MGYVDRTADSALAFKPARIEVFENREKSGLQGR
jgi:hypothetical protein